VHVIYITIIGFMSVLIGWFARELDQTKKKAEENVRAIEQGHLEIEENYEMDLLTLRENIEELEGIRGNLTGQCENYVLDIVSAKATIEELKSNTEIFSKLLAEKNHDITTAAAMMEAAQARARDLEEIVSFHANNCMPHLSEIRAGRFPTAKIDG
jgi:chromosome segregation ATPase